VERLHSYGAIVYALSKTSENLRTLEKEFPGVKTVCLDLGDWESTRNALMELEPMDCLINNAAVLLVRSIMDTTSEEFDRYEKIRSVCFHPNII
jgi:NADP-dependent 3-hydroxy acid dehydrogenase YdfG